MKSSSTALDRKMVKKRHNLTIGYIVFYSATLTLVSMGLSFLLGGTAGTVSFNIPRFLYDSVIGMLFIYNVVAIILQWLFAVIAPGVYQFKELSNNSWNMLYKMDVKPTGLALNKLRVCVFSNLAIYLLGFLFSVGIGFLKSSDRSPDIKTVIFLALIGILSLLVFITPTLAVGAISKGKLFLRLTLLACGGLVFFLLYSCGYLNCAELEDIAASTSKLISLNPLGLVIVPVLFTIVFPIITISTATSRARNYNIEELDDELLVSLGVAENMLVLEEGRNRFNVAISGPDVNDADFDIEVPDLMPEPADVRRRPDNQPEYRVMHENEIGNEFQRDRNMRGHSPQAQQPMKQRNAPSPQKPSQKQRGRGKKQDDYEAYSEYDDD